MIGKVQRKFPVFGVRERASIRLRIDKVLPAPYHTGPYGQKFGQRRLAEGRADGAFAGRRGGGARGEAGPEPACDQRELLMTLPGPRRSARRTVARVGR